MNSPKQKHPSRPHPKKRSSKNSEHSNKNSEHTRGAVQVFGLHAVTSLLQFRPEQVQALEVLAGRADERLQEVLHLATAQKLPIQELSRAELDAKCAGVHQGVIAWAQPRQVASEKDLEDLLSQNFEQPPLLLVLDGVTDPHNLGACMRSAEAAGAVAVIVPKDKSCGLNATVRKVACGATETLPLIQVTNLARCLRNLEAYGVQLVGTAGEAQQLIYDLDLQPATALVMGAEGKGLRRLTREACDQLAKLPMAGAVSSLNVSVAAGICLFEAVRQRTALKKSE